MISVRISFHFLFSLEVDHFTLFELVLHSSVTLS